MKAHSVVFLARHGQTEWNVLGRRQGQLDSPLTDEGRSSADAVGRLLANRGIDRIFSSPQGRALATAEIIARAVDADVTVLDELAEVHHGEMAGLTNAEIADGFANVWATRKADVYEWRFPGGESFRDADARAARALEAVASTAAKAPLLVSHEMMGRLLRAQLLGLQPAVAVTLSHPHGIVFRVEDGKATEISARI